MDFLRAIAVWLVLAVHIPFEVSAVNSRYRWFYAVIKRGGWVGVDLFFVLSGFLVSSLLFKEQLQYGTISFKRFFLRRGLKIYPSFYILFLVTIVVEPLAYGVVLRPHAILDELLFLQNFGPYLWFHCWSLAVEEHFYITLPLGLILSLRLARDKQHPFRHLPIFFIVTACLCLSIRLFTLLYGVRLGLYHNPYNVFFQTHARIDSLLFGVALSYCFHYHHDALQRFFKSYSIALLIPALLLIVPPFVLDQMTFFIVSFGLTMSYLGFGILLMLGLYYLPADPRRSSWLYRSIAYMGSHSYSIYLWHAPVMWWGVSFLRHLWPSVPPVVVLITYLAGSIAVGIGIANLIELPVLRIRDRLFPSRIEGLALTPDKLPFAHPSA